MAASRASRAAGRRQPEVRSPGSWHHAHGGKGETAALQNSAIRGPAGQAVALLLAVSVLATASMRWIPPLTSGVMIERRVGALLAWKSYSIDYRWVPWSRISKHAGLAVIAAEDQSFPTHHGFDVESIQKAIDAAERGRRLRGASTISQQVAKNVFLWSGRSFVRKGLEAYFTVP